MRETVQIERTWRVDNLGKAERGEEFAELDAALDRARELLDNGGAWAVQITPAERIVR